MDAFDIQGTLMGPLDTGRNTSTDAGTVTDGTVTDGTIADGTATDAGTVTDGTIAAGTVTLCWAAKGGSGTTVVTTTIALESPRPTLLVDLAGDIPAVLGMSEPDRPGVADWLVAGGDAAQLDDLLIDIDDTTTLLPHRHRGDARSEPRPVPSDPRWRELSAWFADWALRRSAAAAGAAGAGGSGAAGGGGGRSGGRERGGAGAEVWIDAGSGPPPEGLARRVDRRWLVTRPCYLSLHHAALGPVRPTGVILVDEPGRALRVRDVERSTGAPVVARLLIDPRVARSVDAGLLASRPPYSIRRELGRAVT